MSKFVERKRSPFQSRSFLLLATKRPFTDVWVFHLSLLCNVLQLCTPFDQIDLVTLICSISYDDHPMDERIVFPVIRIMSFMLAGGEEKGSPLGSPSLLTTDVVSMCAPLYARVTHSL